MPTVQSCPGVSWSAPHMWPALSIPPSVTNMPDQFSFAIISIAASAAQVSPPRCPASADGSDPGTKRFPSSGYSHAGGVVAVP